MDKKITSEDFQQEKETERSKVNENKKTKNKSTAQKAVPILIVVVISLLVILLCVLIAYYQVYTSGKQNANILEGVYASSYYTMVDNVNNLSVDIAKYGNLTTTQSKIDTMTDMVADCNYVLSGLSVLPINNENVIAVTKFFNQISGLCEAYSKTLSTGGSLSQEQELVFDEVGLVVNQIKNNLYSQNQSFYSNKFSFVDASVFDNTGMNELSATLGDLSNTSIDYPAMIFDGPFSSALETSEVRGLPDSVVSADEAYDYLYNTVYSGRSDVSISLEGETSGDITTYDYEVSVDGKTFYAQVSKRGGLLITISGYSEKGDAIMSSEQAMELAKTFANNIGFENMDSVWAEVHDNVAYINLASLTADGVILYPDLVKVKVDLTAQEVIGFEALNYALNHTEREYSFDLSEDEAESVLGIDYEVLKLSQTIIRLDSGKEIAAYEFMLERMDGIYFYYINANTGEISLVMKLVTTEGVQKLI